MKRVIVAGGGLGGVMAARELRRLIGAEHEVVLVSKSSELVFRPVLPWVVAGMRPLETARHDLRAVERHGIRFVEAEITRIAPADREVCTTDGQKLVADYIVVALGAYRDKFAVPGLKEAGPPFYCPKGAEACRKAVAAMKGGRLGILVAGEQVTFPAAPYEVAMLLAGDLRRRLGPSAAVDLYTPDPVPIPAVGATAGAFVASLLSARGIHHWPGHVVESVDAANRRIAFRGGKQAGYDVLLTVAPHRAPDCLKDSGLLGADGWVTVDSSSMATRFDGVYAIGDVAGIRMANGCPLPKTGGFAHAQAKVVAERIAASELRREATAVFDGHGTWFVETGDGRGANVRGNYFDPHAQGISASGPSRAWHWAKVAFEKQWVFRYAA